MAVSVVDVGASVYVTGVATIDITTPAGASGDLVVFFMTHDDYSDGAFVASSPPITITSIHDGSPKFGDDSRQAIFWGIENQAGGRAFTFTWTTAEEAAGICIRFAGHYATTPIQSGSVAHREGYSFAPTSADLIDDMFVGSIGTDQGSLINLETPIGWTMRVDATSGGSGARMAVATKLADTYPLPEAHTTLELGNGAYTGYGFVISRDRTAVTVSGITKDKDGSVLVSCEVALFREIGGSPPTYAFIASTTSDAGDGTYSFTVYETDAKYMVYSIKDSTPHVFDASDNVLAPS